MRIILLSMTILMLSACSGVRVRIGQDGMPEFPEQTSTVTNNISTLCANQDCGSLRAYLNDIDRFKKLYTLYKQSERLN